MAVCPICGEDFRSRYECTLHLNVYHSDVVSELDSEMDIYDLVEDDFDNVSPFQHLI